MSWAWKLGPVSTWPSRGRWPHVSITLFYDQKDKIDIFYENQHKITSEIKSWNKLLAWRPTGRSHALPLMEPWSTAWRRGLGSHAIQPTIVLFLLFSDLEHFSLFLSPPTQFHFESVACLPRYRLPFNTGGNLPHISCYWLNKILHFGGISQKIWNHGVVRAEPCF